MSVLEADRYDIDEPDGVRLRFGMRALEVAPHAVTMTMPVGNWANPLTGRPTLAALTILIDTAASTAVFSSRGAGWPVTTELALSYNPDLTGGSGGGADRGPAVIRAERFGSTADWALARATLSIAGQQCGAATLTVAYIRPDEVSAARPVESLDDVESASLGDLLAVAPGVGSGREVTMWQRADPMLLNATRHIHGGVAACGLDLVADAAVNGLHDDDRSMTPFRTGSINVNFIRPFIGGSGSRYIATPVRIGASMAVVDAEAVGDDGKVAATARVTAYRHKR